MSFDAAADLMKILAEEFHRSEISLQEFSELTGISKDRLELVCTGGWKVLTATELGSITSALGIEPGILRSLWTE